VRALLGMTILVGRGTSRRRSRGGTVFGILLGLLAGLVVAVVVALFMTRSSTPFVDKVKRPPERPAETGQPGELPDPNRALHKGRPPAAEAAPGTAVPAPGVPPAATAPPASAPAGTAPGGAAPGAAAVPAPDRAAYLLQAGAFRGQEDADAMKAKLALIGFEARIVTAEVNGVTFYRVRVGPYAQLEDMNRARTRLAENGIEASVVRGR